MNRRNLLGFALLVGVMFGLLLVPAALARSSPATASRADTRPALVPANPTLSPISNTHTAPVTCSVFITYAEPISPATVSTATFAVHAMQTGLLTQTYHVSGGSISLAPTYPFHPGELVQVSATTRTLNLAGQGPLSPTVWAFRTAARGGYAHFVDSGQTFPISDTYGVALGDLDGDGDLDALLGYGPDGGHEV